MSFPNKSIPILNITNDTITIDSGALNTVLSKVGNHHFAFYSINGPSTSGNSFMIKNLFNFLRNDPVDRVEGSNCWTFNSLNKLFKSRGKAAKNKNVGINVCPEPFWIEQSGQKLAILLMDSRVSYAAGMKLQQNAIIFAISTLLSSVAIFNINTDITEDLLQFIQSSTNYATLIDGIQGSDMRTLQNLIFLLRDFQSVTDYKYGYYDDQTLPEEQLLAGGVNFKTDKISSKATEPQKMKFVRSQIERSFHKIGAYLLPQPGKVDSKAKGVDMIFGQHVEKFLDLILSKRIVTKKIGGVEVTGIEMKKHVQDWANVLSQS